ncbi:hypothetical protein EVAR_5920_1 [Eumeta japonica]|uniref:Uncharacterized protein n=1 Tax=Eumeta variegata TaxID=151549 RepID=A0A4C1TC38_EUMVA|nr:hypothetical protein EVAR_5920_1 [Eumeta japonica]
MHFINKRNYSKSLQGQGNAGARVARQILRKGATSTRTFIYATKTTEQRAPGTVDRKKQRRRRPAAGGACLGIVYGLRIFAARQSAGRSFNRPCIWELCGRYSITKLIPPYERLRPGGTCYASCANAERAERQSLDEIATGESIEQSSKDHQIDEEKLRSVASIYLNLIDTRGFLYKNELFSHRTRFRDRGSLPSVTKTVQNLSKLVEREGSNGAEIPLRRPDGFEAKTTTGPIYTHCRGFICLRALCPSHRRKKIQWRAPYVTALYVKRLPGVQYTTSQEVRSRPLCIFFYGALLADGGTAVTESRAE